MKHVMTLNEKPLKASMAHGGCGECQTSCQSACKTSCTVGNQSCENENRKDPGDVGRPLQSEEDCRGSYLAEYFCGLRAAETA